MATKITLKAEKRKITGRKVKSLRQQGILPANLFGKGIKSQSLKIKTSGFEKVFKEAGETNLVYLEIDGKQEVPVLVSNLQLHPVTSQYLHADLYQVDLTKKVTINVPVNLIGESSAVAAGNVLVQAINEIEVESLPTNIPESLDFDISVLKEVGDSIKLSSLKKIDNAEITLDLETTIATIQAPKEQEEPEPVVAEGEDETEPTTEGETKPEDAKEAKPEPQSEDKKEDKKS